MNFTIESGRVFHNVGTQKENARSPYVTEITIGTVKVIWRMNEDLVVDDIVVTETSNSPPE